MQIISFKVRFSSTIRKSTHQIRWCNQLSRHSKITRSQYCQYIWANPVHNPYLLNKNGINSLIYSYFIRRLWVRIKHIISIFPRSLPIIKDQQILNWKCLLFNTQNQISYRYIYVQENSLKNTTIQLQSAGIHTSISTADNSENFTSK